MINTEHVADDAQDQPTAAGDSRRLKTHKERIKLRKHGAQGFMGDYIFLLTTSNSITKAARA